LYEFGHQLVKIRKKTCNILENKYVNRKFFKKRRGRGNSVPRVPVLIIRHTFETKAYLLDYTINKFKIDK
jgi:hypothetical protein